MYSTGILIFWRIRYSKRYSSIPPPPLQNTLEYEEYVVLNTPKKRFVFCLYSLWYSKPEYQRQEYHIIITEYRILTEQTEYRILRVLRAPAPPGTNTCKDTWRIHCPAKVVRILAEYTKEYPKNTPPEYMSRILRGILAEYIWNTYQEYRQY